MRSIALVVAALCPACGPSVEHVGTITTEGSVGPYDATLCGAHDFVEELSCEVASGGGACVFECVDTAHQAFDAECSGGGCRCSYLGQLACSCVFNDPGATCEAVGGSCCPPPWP